MEDKLSTAISRFNLPRTRQRQLSGLVIVERRVRCGQGLVHCNWEVIYDGRNPFP